MAEIVKGEAYSVAFTLKNNGIVITNESVQGVRIMLGNQMATYPDGTLTYCADDQTWRFPLSQGTTYALTGETVDYQSQIMIAGEIFSSKKRQIKVNDTMFRKEWTVDTT